jgi:hypothetical protein
MSTRFPGRGSHGTRATTHASRANDSAFERVMGSRRGWRRLAKRAVVAHERELGEQARQVAAFGPPVLSATSHPLRGRAQAAVVTLTVSLPGWQLQLSGVAAAAAADVAASPAGRRLTRTGRYGVFWWIEIEGALEGDGVTVLLGSALRLYPAGDGSGWAAPLTPELGLPVSG